MGETEENVQELLSQEEVNYTHVDITDDFMFAYVMHAQIFVLSCWNICFPDTKSKELSILRLTRNRKQT